MIFSLSTVVEVAIVGALGAGVGVAELASRYRDAPGLVLKSGPALIYILLNTLASMCALVLIHVFDWRFGLEASPPDPALSATRVLIAGFGAMAFFRSSLFVVRAGGQDVSIGPSSFLHLALNAADREVDRARAKARAEDVAKVMEGLQFDHVAAELPSLALALMQNLPEEDQKQLANRVFLLQNSEMDASVVSQK